MLECAHKHTLMLMHIIQNDLWFIFWIYNNNNILFILMTSLSFFFLRKRSHNLIIFDKFMYIYTAWYHYYKYHNLALIFNVIFFSFFKRAFGIIFNELIFYTKKKTSNLFIIIIDHCMSVCESSRKFWTNSCCAYQFFRCCDSFFHTQTKALRVEEKNSTHFRRRWCHRSHLAGQNS